MYTLLRNIHIFLLVYLYDFLLVYLYDSRRASPLVSGALSTAVRIVVSYGKNVQLQDGVMANIVNFTAGASSIVQQLYSSASPHLASGRRSCKFAARASTTPLRAVSSQ